MEFFEAFWKAVVNFITYCGVLMPELLKGLLTTLKLFAFTIVLSLPLGLFVSFGRISHFKPLKYVSGFFVWLMRGTPLLLQLFFGYFALPFVLPVQLDSFGSALLAFTLNYAAYFAEIFRAGIESIDIGQYEASKALGFGPGSTMRLIIIPQTIKRVVPPVTNETITLVKDTALVAAIALQDLLQSAKSAVSRDFDITAYILAALIYLILTLVLTFIFKKIEKKFQISDNNADLLHT